MKNYYNGKDQKNQILTAVLRISIGFNADHPDPTFFVNADPNPDPRF